MSRPAYNTGNGFFVLNGKLYDANGVAFRIRGVNRNHFDSNSTPGIASSNANAVRVFLYDTGVSGGPATSSFVSVAQGHLDTHVLPILAGTNGVNGSGQAVGTSCNSDASTLSSLVDWWVANEAAFAPIMDELIINVANEWGPADSSDWESAYVSAVTRLRQAGYTCPLMIDTGGCGQDDGDLLDHSQAVFEADPQRNLVFSLHLYGSANDYAAGVASVQKGTTTVVTLASSSATHPFAPGYDGTNNSYSGITAYSFSGAQGMPELDGVHPAAQNVGGSPGAWTITLNVNSTGWGSYTGGATVVDGNGNYALRAARLSGLAQSVGAAYVIGEFGPGRDIGPSPTTVTPEEILTAAESNGLGWLAWAWDDNNLGGGHTNNAWFGMTYNGPGIYTSESDLTMFGQQIVEGCQNPAPGGCGCPDTPVPADTVVAPGCSGTRTPETSGPSLQLAVKATTL